MQKNHKRKIVIINQATNYLTIGFCNAFYEYFSDVSLITGSIHTQGEELDNNIKVRFINKWYGGSNKIKKFISYFFSLLKIYFTLLFKYRKHEIIFISIPPMGYLLNILLPNKFSMIIWDIYPDTFKILGMKENHILYKIWGKLNVKSFMKAYKIFTIGEKLADSLSKYVNKRKIIIKSIWSIFSKEDKVLKEKNHFIKKHNLENKFVIQYSGNIGLTHNVEVLIKLAEMMNSYTDILFQIIGRGPRKTILKKIVNEKKLNNCVFLPFQADDMFPYSLSAAQLGVVILHNSTSAISIPSKSYNLMSLGIPSIYIASKDSELYDYSIKFKNAKCFSENQLDDAVEFILKLKEDIGFYNEISNNSLAASVEFKRENANKFVLSYLNLE